MQSKRIASEPDWTSPADRELDLIAAAQADPRAFAPLYETYVDLVWRYALNRLGDQQRAADATSVTFQRAITALPKYRPQRRGDATTFRSWLMTIARNVVIDETRRARPTSPLDDPASERWLTDPAPGPEEQAVAADERRRINRALARLSTTPRQIVELRLIGMNGREIADTLGMSESAVKTAHYRAIARLRDLLADDETNGASR
ncbi:MAG TPA: sigma-70 family RNA polymerase sigma factor [Thermomicrobiales bacterium]|nr:sigma-70 family RNA polymerase sigma factor [Thermomicrobiales bacterium]